MFPRKPLATRLPPAPAWPLGTGEGTEPAVPTQLLGAAWRSCGKKNPVTSPPPPRARGDGHRGGHRDVPNRHPSLGHSSQRENRWPGGPRCPRSEGHSLGCGDPNPPHPALGVEGNIPPQKNGKRGTPEAGSDPKSSQGIASPRAGLALQLGLEKPNRPMDPAGSAGGGRGRQE